MEVILADCGIVPHSRCLARLYSMVWYGLDGLVRTALLDVTLEAVDEGSVSAFSTCWGSRGTLHEIRRTSRSSEESGVVSTKAQSLCFRRTP